MTLSRTLRFSAIALAFAGAAVTALAADSIAPGDRKFIHDAAVGGMFEVKVSQMAADKTSNAGVKSFAEMLVKDHTAANQELKQVAQQKGVALPDSLPREKQRQIDQLAKKSGDDFDRSYIREVGLNDHRKDIKMFEKESKNGKDADTRAFRHQDPADAARASAGSRTTQRPGSCGRCRRQHHAGNCAKGFDEVVGVKPSRTVRIAILIVAISRYVASA